jgi:peptide/nickel transport system permease protein
MGAFVAKRLASTVLIVGALILIMLVLSAMSPITPGRIALGPKASAEAIRAYDEKVGFFDPLPVRYVHYIEDLLAGDLGVSARTQRSVAGDIGSLWPATLELAIYGMLLAIILGLALGGLAAYSWPGAFALRASMTFLGSAPVFLLAFALLLIFGQQLGWLPMSGRSSFPDPPIGPTGLLTIDTLLVGRLDMWLDSARHLVLPVVTIALLPAVAIGRILRSSTRDVLGTNYIKTARTKGLSEFAVFRRHALRNASGPALSITGLQFGLMLSGVVIIEGIFGWPGLGTYVAESIPANDFPAISAVTLILGVAYVLINLVVDLLQSWADPRVVAS